jgi:hypothetical protein
MNRRTMTGRTMKRVMLFALLAGGLGLAALSASPGRDGDDEDDVIAETETAAEPAARDEPKAATAKPGAAKPTAVVAKPKALAPVKVATPMAEREAVLGFLNKRNGTTRDLVMKPGTGIRIGDVIVKLRACEKTEDWEDERLTGAFVQLLVNDTDKKWRRYFSGWLFKESPSLNVVEHPVYDVWAKECRMRHPDIGPNTIVAKGGETAPKRGSKGEEDE